MIIRKLEEARAGDRNIKSDGWESARLLLAEDGMGFSFHITTLYAGGELKMHYQNHVEAVMILEGSGTIEDLATGAVHELSPGTLYALNDNDRHIVRTEEQITCACVFNPPVTGREVHDASGAYPAKDAMKQREAAAATA